jgi:diguanylate cyclase (GGDEF)-like protein
MADIDHFKRINDTYGHGEGDRALASVADLCRTLVRAEDTIARLGGEEFALLLPETDAAQAVALANRLRAAVEELHLGGLPAPLTISIGISQFLAAETTVDAALSRADQALYAAKRSGRNRVVHFDAAA